MLLCINKNRVIEFWWRRRVISSILLFSTYHLATLLLNWSPHFLYFEPLIKNTLSDGKAMSTFLCNKNILRQVTFKKKKRQVGKKKWSRKNGIALLKNVHAVQILMYLRDTLIKIATEVCTAVPNNTPSKKTNYLRTLSTSCTCTFQFNIIDAITHATILV